MNDKDFARKSDEAFSTFKKYYYIPLVCFGVFVSSLFSTYNFSILLNIAIGIYFIAYGPTTHQGRIDK